MEIKVEQAKLAKALSVVSKVASASRSGLAILNNVLIRVSKNKVTLTTTNLDMAVVDYLPTSDSKDGVVTVPARLLADFVSNLPKDEVVLNEKNGKVTIKSGKYKSVMNGVAADDFPELPEIDEKKAVIFKMGADEFKSGMGAVKIAASSDTTRPALTGVYFNTYEGSLYIAATDGYRLAERKFIRDVKSEVAAIVPAQSINEVLSSLTDEVEEVEILFDEAQVRFRFGEIEITSKLIDGTYPDYRKLIPSGDNVQVKIPRTELVRVTRLAALFAKDAGGSIILEAKSEDGVLAVSSVLNEYGENTSEIETDVSGDSKIVLNARYVLDALNCIEDDDVLVSMFEVGPLLINNGKNATDYNHMIMPLKQ